MIKKKGLMRGYFYGRHKQAMHGRYQLIKFLKSKIS